MQILQVKKFLLFMLWGICFFGFSMPTFAQTSICSDQGLTVPTSECEALADIYTFTIGNQWTTNTNWLQDADIGTWYGVTVTSGHVTAIDLHYNNLLGQFPGTLYQLNHLETLNLENNFLSSLASNFTGPASLRSLNLGYNHLTTIPAGFSSMVGLEDVFLHNNDLVSLPDIFADLSVLEVLHIQWNQLTSLPDSIGSLATLMLLDASENPLTTLPSTWGGMTALTTLDLDNTDLTSLDASITMIPNLQILYLGGNQLTTLPENFGTLTNLWYLGLEENQLTILPSTFSNLINLKYLYLNENDLTTLPENFGNFTGLISLYLQDNQLTILDPVLGNLTELRFLYLENNQLVGALPTSFSQLTLLNRIYLQNNYLDHDRDNKAYIPSALQTWYDTLIDAGKQVILTNQTDITAPVISIDTLPQGLVSGPFMTNITWEEGSYPVNEAGEGLALAISGAGNCDNLSLSVTALTTHTGSLALTLNGAGVFEGCSLTLTDHAANRGEIMLEDIVISDIYADYCNLSVFTTADAIPQSECLALAELYSGTQGTNWTNDTNWFMTSDVEDWFGIHTDVYDGQRHVDGLYFQKSRGSEVNGFMYLRDGNNIQGPLPASIEDLTELRYINVSKNTIGVLPAELGNLSHLVELYAIDAGVSGDIPTNYGDLDALQVLQLSDNILTGPIPDAIYGMSQLKTLSLANNFLTGTLTNGIGAIPGLEYLRLQNNQLSGPLPASVVTLTNLLELDLSDNNFIGTIPTSYGNLTQLETFLIASNALDRDANHYAYVPDSLTAWMNTINLKVTDSQRDDESPIISSSDTIPRVVTGAFSYTLHIDENSYPVTLGGEGMSVSLSGADICSSLMSSQIMNNEGDVDLTLTPTLSGGYMDCLLTVTDHGNNVSNTLLLPSFVYGVGNYTICYDPAMNVDFTECVALVDLYESTDGDGWYDQTNWTTNPDIATWFGVTVLNNHVTEISMGGAQANNLVGPLPATLGNLSHLQIIDVEGNNISGLLPDGLDNWSSLQQVNLSYNLLTGALPDYITTWTGLTYFNVGYNDLSGNIPENISALTNLQILNVQYNNFSQLPTNLSGLNQLTHLYLDNNNFNDSLPDSLADVVSLIVLDLSHNSFNGGVDTITGLTGLTYVNLAYNNFDSILPTGLGGLTNVEYLALAHNNFVGTVPFSRIALIHLDTLYIQGNNLDRDRDPAHEAVIDPALSEWIAGITTVEKDGQGDVTAPVLTDGSAVSVSIFGPIPYSFNLVENSYVIDSAGDGLTVYVSGNVLCNDLYLSSTEITGNNTTIDITLMPTVHGAYNCFLHVVDHAGNDAALYIGPFFYDMTCGNGIIDSVEECDEGRFCNDGTDCTDDSTICPSECQPRFVDGCNPACEPSRCGDGYVNALGQDNILGTNDDEVCDPGSYCANGDDCSRNPDICPTGAAECQPRYLEGCSPTCVSADCGDDSLDADGVDNILGTPDDEECDDGNVLNGDGCSDTCTVEFCGDGYVDLDGPDNNIHVTSDNEWCDQGLANGLMAGVCTSTCKDPNESCMPCRQHCHEILHGGTGAHQIYLLSDRSGSLNGFDRLTNLKLAMTGFVSLLPGVTYDYTGVTITTGSEVGVITFANSASNDILPTEDYQQVMDIIDDIQASAQSNIAEALTLSTNRYINHGDTGSAWHIILMSDGQPTKPNGKKNAAEAAKTAADAAKAAGIEIFTIGLQQGTKGKELLEYIATTTGHYYEDPTNDIMTQIYQKLYGIIQCGCQVDYICDVCGDGEIKYNEECDEGSYCDNGTDCTDDFDLCPEECRPRFINGCTDTCRFDYCGDGELNAPIEACDDGNTLDGDGCSALCQLEYCGDGYLDADGADNIPNNTDDEHCDDGNTTGGDGCSTLCKHEFCGDNFVDLDGVDDDSVTTGDNELCDTGRSCNDGTDCTDDPWICPGECVARYVGLCTNNCDIGICGDGYVQSGSLAVGTGIVVMDEACDMGLRCEDNFTPCGDLPAICGLLNIGSGTCAPRTIGTCTEVCTINICGDGYVGGDEACDDGNVLDGDGCNASCQDEWCGDTVIDGNGADNILNTLDDELCDDGNMIDGDGCTDCKLDSCGNGVWETGEECDTINEQICILPYCRLTSCGDNIRQWPNGSGIGGINNDGYEACDGTTGCLADCSYASGTTYCGDDIIQDPNYFSVTEICDDGINNGQIGFCALDCLSLPTCGNGIVSDTEECDDGNAVDGDGCSSFCTLESPLLVPASLSGSCIAGTLPVVNAEEYIPVWWQLVPVSAVDTLAHDCDSLAPNTWILGTSMQCNFSVIVGSVFGQSVLDLSFTVPCLEQQHVSNSVLADAVATHAHDVVNYPILGSHLVDGASFATQFATQQGQYVLRLDKVSYNYCIQPTTGNMINLTKTYDTDPLCDMSLPVTADYVVQQGATLQEMTTSSLDDFIDVDGDVLLTVGTLLDEEAVADQKSQYQGSDVSYLTEEFTSRYEKLSVERLQGIREADIWKVPNQRTYVYKDTDTLYLDQFELEQIAGDLSEPFTIVVLDADLVLEGSLGSLTTKTIGMFVVGGTITFAHAGCDDTDVIQGIFIANDGFLTTSSKNTSMTSDEWCDGGNMIVQGLLIGSGIDTLANAKRATLDAWDTDTITYVSYEQDPNQVGEQAREIFDICYFPALVEGLNTSLVQNDIFCNHTNVYDYIDMATNILEPYVQQWLLEKQDITCYAPENCMASLPTFACLYDDSDCVVQTSLNCGERKYTCTLGADKYNQSLLNEHVQTCVPDDPIDCMVPYQECEVDTLTNTVNCVEYCDDIGHMTCPLLGTLSWHDAIQSFMEEGIMSIGLPPADYIRRAFDTFNYEQIESSLANVSLSLTLEDAGRFNDTVYMQAFDTELVSRKNTIIAGSALLIEAAPWLWDILPPGATEMLDNIAYFMN